MGATRPRVIMTVVMGVMVNGCVRVMGMVASNNVGRYKSMKDTGNDLDAEKAGNVAAHVDETRGLFVPTVLLEVSQSRREHAKQGGKYLYNLTVSPMHSSNVNEASRANCGY